MEKLYTRMQVYKNIKIMMENAIKNFDGRIYLLI